MLENVARPAAFVVVVDPEESVPFDGVSVIVSPMTATAFP
jgi:hypothetical protein